jgi:hypothetical protein
MIVDVGTGFKGTPPASCKRSAALIIASPAPQFHGATLRDVTIQMSGCRAKLLILPIVPSPTGKSAAANKRE